MQGERKMQEEGEGERAVVQLHQRAPLGVLLLFWNLAPRCPSPSDLFKRRNEWTLEYYQGPSKTSMASAASRILHHSQFPSSRLLCSFPPNISSPFSHSLGLHSFLGPSSQLSKSRICAHLRRCHLRTLCVGQGREVVFIQDRFFLVIRQMCLLLENREIKVSKRNQNSPIIPSLR